MGRIKQLLPLNNEPAIRFCLHRIIQAEISEIVVVLGNHREHIEPHLADLPVTMVVNDREESEMADSVRLGRKAVSEKITGIMVHPADHPLVLAETYRRVAYHHGQHPGKIIVPHCDGRGGHPTLFPAFLLNDSGPVEPLNKLVGRESEMVRHIPVDDPGVRLDMDHPHDYERLASLALQDR